jgi:hypothetical protein
MGAWTSTYADHWSNNRGRLLQTVLQLATSYGVISGIIAAFIFDLSKQDIFLGAAIIGFILGIVFTPYYVRTVLRVKYVGPTSPNAFLEGLRYDLARVRYELKDVSPERQTFDSLIGASDFSVGPLKLFPDTINRITVVLPVSGSEALISGSTPQSVGSGLAALRCGESAT